MRVSIDPEGTEIEAIHDLVDFSGKKVLEVGCGDAELADQAYDVAILAHSL